MIIAIVITILLTALFFSAWLAKKIAAVPNIVTRAAYIDASTTIAFMLGALFVVVVVTI